MVPLLPSLPWTGPVARRGRRESCQAASSGGSDTLHGQEDKPGQPHGTIEATGVEEHDLPPNMREVVGDLEVLKHKGDRAYYEFTLLKGAKPQPVSTVSLQLKKVDTKRGKFTLNVTSDDKTIEKKDRNVNEPIQFYSGRDHMLYELVVWTLDKNKATGYVSTPKTAPVPVTASPTASNQ